MKCYLMKQNSLSFLKKNNQSLSSKQYRRLKRYDVLKIGDTEKLVEAGVIPINNKCPFILMIRFLYIVFNNDKYVMQRFSILAAERALRTLSVCYLLQDKKYFPRISTKKFRD